MKSPENFELLPICSVAAILSGFAAYLIFAPDVLPSIVAACIGALVGLAIACMEEPRGTAVPIEPEEDSFLPLLYRD